MSVSYPFFLDFKGFLEENGVSFRVEEESLFFTSKGILFALVGLEEGSSGLGVGSSGLEEGSSRRCEEFLSRFGGHDGFAGRVIVLFEDLWYSCGDRIRNRVLVQLGFGESVFARKCRVVEVEAGLCSAFLNENHMLGDAAARYRYGLEFGGVFVAVATFSKPRPMKRGDRVLRSYEWVRYSSLGGCRVVGGMGRLFRRFCDDCNPDEVMSYAAKDWSEGEVYKKLGFVHEGDTKPIKFYVNPRTFERYSQNQMSRLASLKDPVSGCNDLLIELFNAGNFKFYWRSIDIG